MNAFFAAMKMGVRIALISTGLLLSLSRSTAQNLTHDQRESMPATFQAKEALRTDVAATFKAGDTTTALAKLRAGVDLNPEAGSVDYQVVVAASSIARTLVVQDYAAGKAAASAAISEASKIRTRLPLQEAATINAKAGDLCERILGDREKAKEFYRAALVRDGKQKEALEGLQRIAHLEDLIEQRAKENEALRQAQK